MSARRPTARRASTRVQHRPGAGVIFQQGSDSLPDPDRYVLFGDRLVRRVDGGAVLQQVGPRVYTNGFAVATLSFTPVFDRAAKIRRFTINNVSAADNWTVTVGGREIMRVRHLTTDNNSVAKLADTAKVGKANLLTWVQNNLGIDASIPLPNGMTITIASIGGATADIMIEAVEVSVEDAAMIGLNHYMGSDFLIPITTFLNASQAAVAVVQDDTQVAPPWVPAIFSATPLPVNWSIDLLALFCDGVSNNSFSGAANHVGTTRNLVVVKNGTQLFTRVANGGPSKTPAAAAAGSANIVTTPLDIQFPPFEVVDDPQENIFELPLTLRGGDVMQILENLVGDLTGGEVFARAMNVWLARVKVPQAVLGQL